jgi:WD40 repeat protein
MPEIINQKLLILATLSITVAANSAATATAASAATSSTFEYGRAKGKPNCQDVFSVLNKNDHSASAIYSTQRELQGSSQIEIKGKGRREVQDKNQVAHLNFVIQELAQFKQAIDTAQKNGDNGLAMTLHHLLRDKLKSAQKMGITAQELVNTLGSSAIDADQIQAEKKAEEVIANAQVLESWLLPHFEYVMSREIRSNQYKIVNAKYTYAQPSPESHLAAHSSSNFIPFIVAACSDNMLRIFDARTHQLVREWPAQVSNLNQLTLSRDNSKLITTFKPEVDNLSKRSGKVKIAGLSNSVQIWDLETASLVQQITIKNEIIRHAELNYNGSQLVTSSSDGYIRRWNTDSGALIEVIESPALLGFGGIKEQEGIDRTWTTGFSPDGKNLVVPSYNRTFLMALVDPKTPANKPASFSAQVKSMTLNAAHTLFTKLDKPIPSSIKRPLFFQVLQGHAGLVTSTTFSTNGQKMITTSLDDKAVLWDIKNGQLLIAFIDGNMDDVISASFNFNEALVLTTSQDGTVRIWDTFNGGKKVSEIVGTTDRYLSASFFPGIEDEIMTVSKFGYLQFWQR